MKQFFTLIFISFFVFGMNAQVTFSDDFESYDVGDYIDATSTDWTTWGNTPGGAGDARITDEKASSGTNSLKIFAANSGGGPMDILLPFGDAYTDGRFIQSMKLFIEEGKEAYFNYQAEKQIGTTWALNGFFRANGTLDLTNSNNAVVFSTPYLQDEWVELTLDINLTLNIWNVSINGECVGSFNNSIAKIASLNLYPINANHTFYVDDVSYEHQLVAQEINVDLGVSNLSYNGGKLAGTSNSATFQITNNGKTVINDIELSILANGSSYIKTYNTLDLASGESLNVSLDDDVTLIEGENVISVSVLSVDGVLGDDEGCNDKALVNIDAIVPAKFKGVIVEEGTGTWCQWCVRGTVFMDRLSNAYEEYFIPIAVHNGDPMVVDNYDTFIGNWPDFSGYPNVVIARQNATGFGVIPDMENPFLAEVVKPAPLFLSAGAEYDATTGLLNIEAFVTFFENSNDDYHLNLIITEDGVTGTSSGYAQSNAYAGGGQGPMGGYELLPSPVPASQMVYDHVARAAYGLSPSASNTITGPFIEGQTVAVSFSHQVDPSHDTDNMYIIPIANKGNEYINAREVHLSDALSRGTTGVKSVAQKLNTVKVYPNPTTGVSNFDITLDNPSEVIIELMDATGKVIASANHGKLSGTFTIPVNVNALANGIYVARIITDEGTSLNRIVVEH